MSTLQVIWFFLLGVFITGYAILDGFDLGVGFWQLFNGKNDKAKRIFLNAIGPVWDGNEVWLITGGGVIFAAFPMVYATVFSGFYLALMLVLLGLMLRAVAIEFRHQVESESWKKTWDLAFSVGSILPAILFGVALGNIMRGIPLDANGDYTGGFFNLLNPFSLIIGLTGFAMIITQGALYLTLKTEDEIEEKAKGWAFSAWIGYLALYIIAAIASVVGQPHLMNNYKAFPFLWLVPLLALAAIVMIGVFIKKDQMKSAFITSSISIAGLMAVTGSAIFPNLVRASNNPNFSLTIGNASSSSYTLTAMLIISVLVMPIVLGYTVWVYKAFKGKVDLDKSIY